MINPQRIFIGLDLGQAQDFTALAVLRRPRNTEYHETEPAKPPYDLPFLKRFPLGTPYTEIVPFIVDLLQTPELRSLMLVVDYTGVGRAVGDMFTEAFDKKVNCRYCPITITGGRTVSPSQGGGYNVPKKELVSAFQVVMQTRRLRIAPALPEAELLVKELQNFRVKITVAANETFEAWREGQHDDMVLATALAVWAGEQALPSEVFPSVPRVNGGPERYGWR